MQPAATAGRILQHYRKWGDGARTRPVVDHVPGGRVSAFVTKTLKRFRSFVLSVGGCGLSGQGKEEFWDTAVMGEREALFGTGRKGPMEAAFSSADAFVASLRADADRCMQELDWRETDFEIRNQKAVFYSRDLMQVLVEAAEGAKELDIRGERKLDANDKVVRTGTLDSDVYLDEQARVLDMHGRDGEAKVFTIAVQMFSDAALVSWSGGASACSCCGACMWWVSGPCGAFYCLETDAPLFFPCTCFQLFFVCFLFCAHRSPPHVSRTGPLPKRLEGAVALDNGGISPAPESAARPLPR